MAGRRFLRTAIVAAVTILSLSAAGTAALASSADTTPPSAPRIVYAQGWSTQHRPQHHQRRDRLPLLTISGTFLRQFGPAKPR